MSRAVPEWRGKTPDAPVPPRVRLRVFLRFNGTCQCGCGRKIRPGERWQLDDKIALINGGERRESNLWPMLREHHRDKTRQDVAEKAVTYRKRLRHTGIKKAPKGRPMPGTKASGVRKRMNGTVERW